MTEEERKRRTCGIKRPYISKQSAKKDAKMLMKHDPGKRRRPYNCPYCNKWHLTKQKLRCKEEDNELHI